jgi:hypothetical protein
MFPFDSTEACVGGGFTDVLEIRADGVWSELGASGVWLCVEPVLHVDLKLVLVD